MNLPLIKKPTAYLPLTMSLAALAMVLIHFAINGIEHEADEGTAAHIFQLLMAAQLPLMLFFAIKWFPENPMETLKVLVLQAVAWLLAIAAVFFLT